jgi:hypothetical protein
LEGGSTDLEQRLRDYMTMNDARYEALANLLGRGFYNLYDTFKPEVPVPVTAQINLINN